MSILDWYRRVQYTTGVREHPIIESLKKQARQLHRDYPEYTLMQAQDMVAERHGFMHWHHAMRIAEHYTKVYEEASRPSPSWRTSHAPRRTRTKEELAPHAARWLGQTEFGAWHVGQTENTQRLHTLVLGQHIGVQYMNVWLADHLAQRETFLAWITPKALPAFLSDFDNRSGPLILRLGSKPSSAMDQSLNLRWSSLSDMHAWVNVMAPNLVKTAMQSTLLENLLAWVWTQTSDKTGPTLAQWLTPAQLSAFPGWALNSHDTLLLAGHLAQMLRKSQPFNKDGLSVVTALTPAELFNHPVGVVILDAGEPEDELFRSSLHAYMRSYIGHRLGIGHIEAGSKLPSSRYAPMHWYMMNLNNALLAPHAAQCRALNIGLTFLWDEEPSTEMHPQVRANCMTRLKASPTACNYALYSYGNAFAVEEPLAIDLNASEPSR